MKKFFEPVTKSLEKTSQDITKTIKETSTKNNQAIDNLNDKLLEILNDRGIRASYLLSPLSIVTNTEKKSQFNLLKDSNLNKVNDLLTHYTKTVISYNTLLTFRDTDKKFVLRGDLLKMITNRNYNVDHVNLSDKKILYEFAKEMNFDVKSTGSKNPRDGSLIGLLKSPAIMASGISTIFLSENHNEFCDRTKLLLEEKQSGNSSLLIDEEIVSIIDKLLEYKCLSKNNISKF